MKTQSETLRILKSTDKFLSHSNKWCKGGKSKMGQTKNGRYCLGTAAHHAAGEEIEASSILASLDVLNRTIKEKDQKNRVGEQLNPADLVIGTDDTTDYNLVYNLVYQPRSFIVPFNDHPKTTFADIKKVLKSAIRIASRS